MDEHDATLRFKVLYSMCSKFKFFKKEDKVVDMLLSKDSFV